MLLPRANFFASVSLQKLGERRSQTILFHRRFFQKRDPTLCHEHRSAIQAQPYSLSKTKFFSASPLLNISATAASVCFRVIEAAGSLEAKTVLQHGPQTHVLFADASLAGSDNSFALAQWTRRYRPKITIILSAGLTRKSEAAAHLCSLKQTPPPASYLRDRIQAMKAQHGRRSRDDRRPKAKAAYR